MKGTVHYEQRGRVAVLRIDNPPVNALSSGVRQGLADGVSRALADDGVEALVVLGDGRTFIAGADITEFGKPNVPGPDLHSILAAMEGSEKPIVAALHGTALGGGLETALCCDYRVAVDSAKVGLPEVNLGLLPGAGGTQRLPRLAGAAKALQMMIGGAPIGAKDAQQSGVVDAIVEGDLLDGAIAFAEGVLDEGRGTRKIRDITPPGDTGEEAFEAAAALAKKRRRGQTAPGRIIACVRQALSGEDFDAGLTRERALFAECMGDPQRAAMIHAFFAERQVGKIPDVPKDTKVAGVERVAVIGAGTMGAGIATCFANAGVEVTLTDKDEAGLDRGLAVVRRNIDKAAKRGKISAEQADERKGRVTGALDLGAVAGVDLVVEAVFEELELKKTLFAELDRTVGPDALLATNTSTLDIDAIASATGRPGSVVGMHFFSPAHVMRLLEVVRGKESSKTAIATAMRLGKRLGKVAVLAGNCDGFIGNRMLAGYGREAAFLVEEGALPQQVDQALLAFGMPMGPFAMGDMAGLDVGWRIRKQRGRPEGRRYSPLADRICERGRFGQKTGAGWYRYEEGSHTPIPDPEIEALVVATSEELGVARREVGDEEIVQRCIYALINEGARLLGEGIALRASDIDVIYINGYGFPVFRGGPMFYAQQVGLAEVLATVRRFEEVHGDLWTPAPLLVERADAGTWA